MQIINQRRPCILTEMTNKLQNIHKTARNKYIFKQKTLILFYLVIQIIQRNCRKKFYKEISMIRKIKQNSPKAH